MKTEKPESQKLYEKLRKDDKLIVPSLRRLGRTSKQLIDLIHHLIEKGGSSKV